MKTEFTAWGHRLLKNVGTAVIYSTCLKDCFQRHSVLSSGNQF